ncbi:1-aminocyclopropane-1-carboxylate deaminase/D-cysteine desulfhydrase [Streptomyces sp. M19]
MAAAEAGHTRLLTFGGAYSHHLRAVAAAAAAHGMSSVGIVRGAELADAPATGRSPWPRSPGWSWRSSPGAPTGTRCARWTTRPPRRPSRTAGAAPGSCPRGLQRAGRARAAETVAELPDLGPRDVVCCAVGTGGTLAGIAAALPEGARALGVAALKGGSGYLEEEVARLHVRGWGRTFANWSIDHTHHGGGYGRVPAELAAFAGDFAERHGTPVELRYVAKALRCVYDRATGGAWPGHPDHGGDHRPARPGARVGAGHVSPYRRHAREPRTAAVYVSYAPAPRT